MSGLTDFGAIDPTAPETMKEEADVPGELQWLWMVESYHALPNAGALLDQPNHLMNCMNVCRNARDEISLIREHILRSREEQRNAAAQ